MSARVSKSDSAGPPASKLPCGPDRAGREAQLVSDYIRSAARQNRQRGQAGRKAVYDFVYGAIAATDNNQILP